MTPRLRSLELHGYKTFAGRTLFEFPGDVTAIVGPNGSGKSNIADSLRWVLGEQSYSLLRGRKTEDMIFSGSELRPRAGMASATITFSNEDGWLPIEFNEVSIARRAYRDGQNEYLLNGQRVRLKEISELLSKSGLAERTYTIIGQGLVDAALSLRPEERRRFFEEAAGIGLYRSRREEALTRLDTTRRNLERVLDILAELDPRLKSLEKQARRAQEFERIQADLRLLLRDWYGFHWHSTQQEIIHARQVLHVQEERLETARSYQLEIEERLGELRANVLELRTALNEWHIQSARTHTRWEKASRSLAVMEERRRALIHQQQNLEIDINHLEDEQKARRERLDALIEERDRLQDELEEALAQVTAARKKLQTRLAERGRIEQALREVRRSLIASETFQVQQKAHQSELANRIDTLRKNKLTFSAAVSAEAENLKKANLTLENQAEERGQAEASQKNAEEALLSNRRKVSDLEVERKVLQDECARLEGERSRISAQLEVLEQAERSLNGLPNGAKFILQEARSGRLKGICRALSSSLVVPAELELAVAAALGEALDSVLFEGGTDPEAALQALSSGDKGRTMLIPLENLQAVKSLPAIEDPGCVGIASELVRTTGSQAVVLCLLLGQVMIVRDRPAARRLVERLPVGARAVTLQGEVFNRNGTIVAGQDSRASLIGRPRRMQELHVSLAEVDTQMADFKERWQIGEDQIQALRLIERNLDQAFRQAAQVLKAANQAHQQAILEVEQAKQRHDFQARQLSGIDGQIGRADQELGQVQAEIEKNSQSISLFNEQIRAHNQELGKLPLEEFQSQEVHWNTAFAVAGRAVKETERRLVEHREALDAASRQMEGLRQRLSSIQADLQRQEIEKATLYAEEAGLSQEIETLRMQIEPAEEQVEYVEKAYSEQQDILTASQQAVSVADRHVSQAQLELSRSREALESLRRRIEEDFGQVSFEYHSESSGATPLPFIGMIEELPDLVELSPEIEENINRQRALLRRIGPINPEVQNEYRSVKERFEFLTSQVADLQKADSDLRLVITQLDDLMRKEFRRTFDAVAAEFRLMFTRLFGGGSARLVLSDPDQPTEGGIDIEARLPGRRTQGLSLLSGGERSLTAVALIFSLLKVSPTPFCVLDEVDAMLDEANVGRFRDLLIELSPNTQFIIVTHNRNTVQAANVIYGVTMGRDSASQVISLKLDEINDEIIK